MGSNLNSLAGRRGRIQGRIVCSGFHSPDYAALHPGYNCDEHINNLCVSVPLRSAKGSEPLLFDNYMPVLLFVVAGTVSQSRPLLRNSFACRRHDSLTFRGPQSIRRYPQVPALPEGRG